MGLRQLSDALESDRGDSFVVFHKDFLPVVDAVLSKLITWAEGEASHDLKRWAGRALADRVRAVSAQEKRWRDTNPAFEERTIEFGAGDKRGARAPECEIAWLSGDYLRELESRRSVIQRYAAVPVADVFPGFEQQGGWREKLIALPIFDEHSWPQWAKTVYERMCENEDEILARMESKGAPLTRDACERRGETKRVRLYDYIPNINAAIKSLAAKPIGTIRGITKPRSEV